MSKIGYPTTTWLSGVALVLAFAVVFTTPTEAAKGGGGCNEGVLMPAAATFRDATGNAPNGDDGIQSDGGGTYDHCVDGQVSIGKSEGRFRIDTKKYNPMLRKMVVKLDTADCRSASCTGAPLLLTTDVIFQTHTLYTCSGGVSTCVAQPGTILDLRAMTLDQVAYARLTVSFLQTNKTTTLAFLNATEGIVDGMAACAGGNPVRIECSSASGSSCTGWSMEGDMACYNKYLRGPGATFQGLFSVPVQFDVELLP